MRISPVGVAARVRRRSTPRSLRNTPLTLVLFFTRVRAADARRRALPLRRSSPSSALTVLHVAVRRRGAPVGHQRRAGRPGRGGPQHRARLRPDRVARRAAPGVPDDGSAAHQRLHRPHQEHLGRRRLLRGRALRDDPSARERQRQHRAADPLHRRRAVPGHHRPAGLWPARLHVVTGKGGTGKTTVAAALALALAAERPAHPAGRGRGPAGHRPAVRPASRCRTRSGGSPPRRAAARSGRWPSTPRRRCSSTSTCSTSWAWPAGRCARSAPIDFATTIAPGLRDVLLTGKVKEAVTRTAGRPPGLRRGGARRAADRPDRPLPQRHRRDRPAGQGRPDQDPERGRRRASCARR